MGGLSLYATPGALPGFWGCRGLGSRGSGFRGFGGLGFWGVWGLEIEGFRAGLGFTGLGGQGFWLFRVPESSIPPS